MNLFINNSAYLYNIYICTLYGTSRGMFIGLNKPIASMCQSGRVVRWLE